MPSLSASVAKDKLKVMRPGKPVARKVPYQAGTAAAGQASGASPASPGIAATGAAKGGGGFMRADGGTAANGWTPQTGASTASPPRLATGGGFQFRPRNTVGVGGYPLLGAGGPGGGGDIQTAIKSLRDQLGMPAGTPTVEPGTGEDMQTSVSTAPEPAWKQLAGMGVGGQGSARANRAKLAELLAARTGGGMMPPGAEPGAGAPNAQANPAVADAANAYIRRLPATISDPSASLGVGASVGDGSGGASLAGNQGPIGPGPGAQNPYMDILNRRLSGFGVGGRGGFNPGAAVQYAR